MPRALQRLQREQDDAIQRAADPPAVLRRLGLRPTRQRVALVAHILAGDKHHFSAETLFAQLRSVGTAISLPTVYNGLNELVQAGLLRSLAVQGKCRLFDANMSDHHHFLFPDKKEIADIPEGSMQVAAIPAAPEGFEIVRIDVFVQLQSRSSHSESINS